MRRSGVRSSSSPPTNMKGLRRKTAAPCHFWIPRRDRHWVKPGPRKNCDTAAGRRQLAGLSRRCQRRLRSPYPSHPEVRIGAPNLSGSEPAKGFRRAILEAGPPIATPHIRSGAYIGSPNCSAHQQPIQHLQLDAVLQERVPNGTVPPMRAKERAALSGHRAAASTRAGAPA